MFGCLSHLLDLLVGYVRCEVDVDGPDVVQRFNLIQEMFSQTLQIVQFNVMQSWTSLQQLVYLVPNIDQSSHLQHLQMLQTLSRLAFDNISLEYIVHAIISQILTSCQDQSLQRKAHSYFYHQLIIHLFAGVERYIQICQLL